MNAIDKITDKIRKLLALARDKGASEAEAAAAMAMASDLMIKYNIDHVEDRDAPGVYDGDYSTEKFDQKWHAFLHTSVAALYDCRSVSWVGRRKFVGRKVNVLACDDTWVYVLEQIEALYKQGLKAFKGDRRLTKETRGEFRTTFKEACALRLWRKVQEIKAAQKNKIPDHRALVVIDTMKQEIDEHFAAQGIKTGRALQIRRTGFGTGAGFAAADQINLTRRVD